MILAKRADRRKPRRQNYHDYQKSGCDAPELHKLFLAYPVLGIWYFLGSGTIWRRECLALNCFGLEQLLR